MTKNPSTIIAGILQFDVKTGDIDANLTSVINGINRLGEKEAQITVLPELWSCGFDKPGGVNAHSGKTPQIIKTLSTLAKKHRMIIAGSLPEKSGDRLYNTMMVIDKDGAIAGQYRKVHLFSFIGEDKAFSAGNQAVVCDTSSGPIGLMLCYDLRFPELCRSLALAGARMVVVSAQWPESRIHHWNTLLAARAIENQIFIAASNRVGKDVDLTFNGHSQIISPDGKVLACIIDQTAETTVQINFKEIETIRNRFDCLKERVPAAYKP
ncbi:MAG: carbon-nitrogen family hydrolase [Desulfobacteraceae bacterium]|nr:carbon-nitrogen family hydrolase [Desulfobacteraceae bacterium]MBC2754561.1 carbon-nitrogen family hydrolase [Desulfobacteraceae bacterium]MBC2763774.1 carbon-nitrogen family hydrolase [ANME-2 cluster archaeon]